MKTEDLVPEFQPTGQDLRTLCRSLKVSVNMSDRNYYYLYEQKKIIKYMCKGHSYENGKALQLQNKVLKHLNRKMDEYRTKVLEPEYEKFTRNRLKFWRLRKFYCFLFLSNLKKKTGLNESSSTDSSTSEATVIFSGKQPEEIIGNRSAGENLDTEQNNSREQHHSNSETFLLNTEENFLHDVNSNVQSSEEQRY